MSYHLTLVRVTIIKKSTNKRMVEKMWEKKEPFYAVCMNINWCSHYGEQYGSYS